MSSQQLDEERIFHVARQIPVEAARSEYLDQVCAGDVGLRDRVEALLEAHENEQSFLKSDPDAAPTVDHTPLTEHPGTTIGRYKLMEQIGEGGMGTVFVAEQERPIRRKVALKVIKPGMDSKAVVARFEAERQALALMDHPNIAKVLDAGTTDSGRPYFVMELVRGIPITEYCDEHKLTIRERLELFTQVCQAIQHAHQKAIIHRDIKPTNVLVTEQDGKPVPKVIDFGVAKALNQRLTDHTIYTSFAQVVGTPLYMSPEQAALSAVDVDTRSDVYSLGVLLYELLTGTTPFDKQRFEQAAYDEIRRIVREEEPPKPSTKISTLGDQGSTVAQNRRTDHDKLGRAVRGDLDWIVMKALEKERARRYETANAVLTDIVHYLDDEPVTAYPPSISYRLAKFARRNTMALLSCGIVFILLLLGFVAVGNLALSLQAEVEQHKTTLAQLAESSYDRAATAALAGDIELARESLDATLRARNSKYEYEYEKNVIEGLIAFNQGKYDTANQLATDALSDELVQSAARQIAARALLTNVRWSLGDSEGYRQGIQALRSVIPTTDTDHLLMSHALVLQDPRESLRLLSSSPRAERSAIGLLTRGIARLHVGGDDQDLEAVDKAIRDIECSRLLTGSDGASLAWNLYAIAVAVEISRSTGRYEDASRYLQSGLSLSEKPATDSSLSHELRWIFFRTAGETKKATDEIRQVGRYPGYGTMLLAADCLQRLDEATALAEFDKAIRPRYEESKFVRLAKSHFLFGTETGAGDVLHLVSDLIDTDSSFQGLFALYPLCLVAEPGEVHDKAREFVYRIENAAHADTDLFCNLACLRFLAGGADVELLHAVGDGAFAGAQAHFTIGMLRLAEKRPAEALEHFQLGVDTNAIGTFGYEFARAYKERIVREPTWAPWSPAEPSR